MLRFGKNSNRKKNNENFEDDSFFDDNLGSGKIIKEDIEKNAENKTAQLKPSSSHYKNRFNFENNKKLKINVKNMKERFETIGKFNKSKE